MKWKWNLVKTLYQPWAYSNERGQKCCRDFEDKNKKANCLEKIGEKFNLSAAEVEVKFRNVRTA